MRMRMRIMMEGGEGRRREEPAGPGPGDWGEVPVEKTDELEASEARRQARLRNQMQENTI
eukprot:730972-Rhodomonas_salina.1